MAKKSVIADEDLAKGEIVEEVLPIQLTEQELKEVADSVSEIYQDLADTRQKASDVRKKWAAQIRELETELAEEMRIYKNKFEERKVSATKVVDGNQVRFYVDQKLIHERKATDADKQVNFAFLRKKPMKIEDEA